MVKLTYYDYVGSLEEDFEELRRNGIKVSYTVFSADQDTVHHWMPFVVMTFDDPSEMKAFALERGMVESEKDYNDWLDKNGNVDFRGVPTLYKFACRFTEYEEEFVADARKLIGDKGSLHIDERPSDFGLIEVTTDNLKGLVDFINKWYNRDNSFGITTESDPIKRFGIEVL